MSRARLILGEQPAVFPLPGAPGGRLRGWLTEWAGGSGSIITDTQPNVRQRQADLRVSHAEAKAAEGVSAEGYYRRCADQAATTYQVPTAAALRRFNDELHQAVVFIWTWWEVDL